jgi:hypothetical protein
MTDLRIGGVGKRYARAPSGRLPVVVETETGGASPY